MNHQTINNTPVREYDLQQEPIWEIRENGERIIAGYNYVLTFETSFNSLGDEFRNADTFTVDMHNGIFFTGWVVEKQVTYNGSFETVRVTVRGESK